MKSQTNKIKLTAKGFRSVAENTPCDLDPKEINLCKIFIRGRFLKSEFMSPNTSEHYLKDVEEWSESTPNGYTRISNGAFIQACINLGFKVKRKGLNANVWLKYKLWKL